MGLNCLIILIIVVIGLPFIYFIVILFIYRFKLRSKKKEEKWLGESISLDHSLQIEHRSLDNLCFSWQFYFICTILIYGICLTSLSVSIMIRNEYIFFSDPFLFPATFVIAFLIIIFKFIADFVI